LPTEDRWILSRLNSTITSVNKSLEEFQFGEALGRIYDFLWSEYCDWYIELAKIRLKPESKETSPLPVLVHVLEASLRLLHPFMPFLTEELWQNLRRRLPEDWQKSDSVMISTYPRTDTKMLDTKSEQIIDSIVDIIRTIRNAVRIQSRT